MMGETTTRLPRPQSGEHLARIAHETPAGEWAAVAFYPALEEGADPAEVTVSANRLQDMTFYRITSTQAGIDLTTGTGLHDLAHDIAEAVCAGMLGVSEDDQR